MNAELIEKTRQTPAEDYDQEEQVEEQVGEQVEEQVGVKVVQHCHLRFLLRPLRPEGFERHRAAKWPNCNCFSKNAHDATFNRLLMYFFLIALGLTLINVIIFEQFLKRIVPPPNVVDPTKRFQMEQRIVLLTLLAVVVVVVVFVKMTTKNAGSAPPRREEEVQTISAAVQQV